MTAQHAGYLYEQLQSHVDVLGLLDSLLSPFLAHNLTHTSISILR